MIARLPPALRLRDFALLWAAQLTSGLASQMLVVAIGWQVYEIHKSPFDLGLVGLMEFLPLPVLALPSGQLADRLPRRAVTAASYVVWIAVPIALVFVTLSGADALWPFLGLGVVTGVASVVGNPAVRALTREIIPEEMLAPAMALRSIASRIGVIVGPALGGVIFAIEPVAVYVTAAVLLLLSLGTVLATRAQAAPVPVEAPGWESLVAGVRFITRTRMLLGAIGLDLVAVLLGDSIALAPVFASSILHTGPVGLGLLRASPSVGALLAAVLLARQPLRHRAGPALLTVVAVFGATMVVFGVSKSLPLSMAALACSGFVDMISVNIRMTAVAVITPLHLQGRVAAVEWVFISASNELGAFWSGSFATLIGTVPSVVVGGAAMIGVSGAWRRLFPTLARMGRLQDLRPEGA